MRQQLLQALRQLQAEVQRGESGIEVPHLPLPAELVRRRLPAMNQDALHAHARQHQGDAFRFLAMQEPQQLDLLEELEPDAGSDLLIAALCWARWADSCLGHLIAELERAPNARTALLRATAEALKDYEDPQMI